MRYPVVIHQEGNSAFGVTVPDIVGCFSAGDTIEEAMENVKEALYDHLELVTAEGGEISAASTITDLKKNPEFADGMWALIDVNVEDLLGPAERVNVTIPKRALQKIDLAAKSLGDTRSGLLRRAALELISLEDPVSRMRKAYGASLVLNAKTDKNPAFKEKATSQVSSRTGNELTRVTGALQVSPSSPRAAARSPRAEKKPAKRSGK